MILRSIEPISLPEILDYCKELETFQTSIGIPPADNLERFCIGYYQLAGAIGWRATPCEDESWASAAIHFIVVMESLKMKPESFVPRDLKSMFRMVPDFKLLMLRSANAMRMLFYTRQKGKTIRSARYDKNVLEADLGLLTMHCIAAIPTEMRTKAFYDATEILSKRV